MAECRNCVLVADDEPALREMTAMVLEDMGLTVITAEDGWSCVELFRQQAESVGLVILDVTMPGMDGLDCMRQLRRIRPAVRVILTSGYSAEDVASDDGDYFLCKPYTPETLRQAVSSLLHLD